MVINFKDYNEEFLKLKDVSLSYEEMLDKVLNENVGQIHTMLMKSDFENFLTNQNEILTECKQFDVDLSDLKLYEKELTNSSGDETR